MCLGFSRPSPSGAMPTARMDGRGRGNGEVIDHGRAVTLRLFSGRRRTSRFTQSGGDQGRALHESFRRARASAIAPRSRGFGGQVLVADFERLALPNRAATHPSPKRLRPAGKIAPDRILLVGPELARGPAWHGFFRRARASALAPHSRGFGGQVLGPNIIWNVAAPPRRRGALHESFS